MKPSPESFSTVIVGQWNPGIFRPDWVKSNLANDPTKQIEIAFPIGDPTLPPRIQVENVFIFPSPNRLDIKAENPTKEGLVDTARTAVKCLELLSHTPVTAIGINVSFTSSAADADPITRLFSFEDDARIDHDHFKLQSAELKRSFKLDGCTLNLLVSYNTTDVKVDFNFHFDSDSAKTAADNIQKNPVDALFDTAAGFLTATYGLAIEE